MSVSNEKIKIDQEIASLCRKLTGEEFESLEANILRDGVRDALVVWDGKNILLDGHNRYRLAQQHSLVYRVKALKFASIDEAKLWVVVNQLGRRNLTPEEASYLRGIEYRLTKKEAHRPEKGGQNVHLTEKTADTLAKKHGVDARTIRRDAEFAEAVDTLESESPGMREKVLAGKGPTKKAIVNAVRDAKNGDKKKRRDPGVRAKQAMQNLSEKAMAALKGAWMHLNHTQRKEFIAWTKTEEGRYCDPYLPDSAKEA